MARKTARSAQIISERFILQLVLGIMFIALGILGIRGYSSDLAQAGRALGRIFGSSPGSFNLVIAVIQLAAGIFLVADLFAAIPANIVIVLHLVIFGLFALNMVAGYLLNNFLKPDGLRWLAAFSKDAVILASLWAVRRSG